MGGHAPIVGAELFVFQAGQSGYASAPTNVLSSGYAGTDPTYGNYILTGPSGTFNVTGDYTCTAGHPVYVAAVGGTPSTTATLIYITSALVVPSGNVNIVQFSAPNSLTVGSTVSFANGAFPSTSGLAPLNGTTQTVTLANPNVFNIATTASVSGTAAGFALVGGLPNPAIANIAVLGDCPGTGTEFAGTLSFVYIDEVSTTAAAYALNAFGTGFYAIGAPASNLAGIERAAINAGQLYNINNNYQSGGVALATTNYVGGSNGVVPQATVDTIGNILSACVDSANTSTTASDECNTLFATATSNGDTTGTKPTDISSAAFNIAAHPAGTGSQHGTFTNTLYNLQGSSVTPFSPHLAAAPNDFGVAITYNNSLNTEVGESESVAVDGNGQVWTTAQTDKNITLWSAVGKVISNNSSGYIYGYTSVDPSNNAWVGAATVNAGIQEFNSSGGLANTFGTGFANVVALVANGSTVTNTNAAAYFFAGNNAQSGYWYTATGGGGTLGGVAGPYGVSNNFISHGAVDSTGDLYLTSEASNQISRFHPQEGVLGLLIAGFFQQAGFPVAGPTVTGAAHQPQPEAPSVDSANNVWVPIQTTYSAIGSTTPTPGLYKVSPTGTTTAYYSGTGTSTATKIYTGANFYQSFGSAIDGNGNVWITNRYNPSLGGTFGAAGSSTLIELNSAGTALSPSTNYTYGGILNDPLNLAIDPCGDIWVTNYNGNEFVEILGAAAPVTTPLSAAAAAGSLGEKP
jgi:hypothetical protein